MNSGSGSGGGGNVDGGGSCSGGACDSGGSAAGTEEETVVAEEEPEGHHFSMLQHEAEKLKVDIEKMCSELGYEIDKVTAGQRLDLNLERGRIRDELANQGQETSNLTNKLDREIHALRAQVEAAKYDIVKYCIGTLVSISAVGLAIIRILM